MLLGNAEMEIKKMTRAPGKCQQSWVAFERWGNGYKDTTATNAT
jgi:hypothetical protein